MIGTLGVVANLEELEAVTGQLTLASAQLSWGIEAASLFGEPASRSGEEWTTFSANMQDALGLLAETLVQIPVNRTRPGVHALDQLLEEVAGLSVRLRADPTGAALKEITARLVPVDGAISTLVRDLNSRVQTSRLTEELESLKQQRADIAATEAKLASVKDEIDEVFESFDKHGGHPAIWADMESIISELKDVADACDERVASGE